MCYVADFDVAEMIYKRICNVFCSCNINNVRYACAEYLIKYFMFRNFKECACNVIKRYVAVNIFNDCKNVFACNDFADVINTDAISCFQESITFSRVEIFKNVTDGDVAELIKQSANDIIARCDFNDVRYACV